MKKILLSLALVLGIFALYSEVNAAPSEESQLFINNKYIYIEGTYYENVIPGVSYDETTNELTLDSCDLETILIYQFGEDFKINVKGENNVSNIEFQETDVTIDGTGSLFMDDSESNTYIHIFDGTCTFKNIELGFGGAGDIREVTAIIAQHNDIYIDNVTITFRNIRGLISSKSLKISSSSISGTGISDMLIADDIEINDSLIEAEDVKMSLIYVDNKVEISETDINVQGENEEAFLMSLSDMVIVDSDIKLKSYSQAEAIYVSDTLTVKDSNVLVASNSLGISCGEFVGASSDIELTCSAVAMQVDKAVIESSDLSIKCEEEISCGIICKALETNESNIDISGAYFGILSEDKVNFNSGEIKIDSNNVAVVVMKNENTPGISLENGMITVPSAPIYSTYNEDLNSYFVTFATDEIIVDETTLKITNAVEDIVIKEENIYQVIEGANQTYTKGKDNTLKFKIDAPYSNFESIVINEKTIPQTEYTTKEGSTIVELSKDFLTEFENDTYEITFEFTDGYAKTTFKVVEAPKDNTPGTGTRSYMPYAICVSIMALAGIVIFAKKQSN